MNSKAQMNLFALMLPFDNITIHLTFCYMITIYNIDHTLLYNYGKG